MDRGDADLDAALGRIRRAAGVLAEDVRRTPTVYSYTFSESAGCDVWLKLENLQRTGSFKIRGALHKIRGLTPAQRAAGLVAASAGNHAQGVALAARLCGTTATIVMPRATALIKIQRTEGYGATVVLHGDTWDEAQEHAQVLAASHGWTQVHPFDDPELIDGQGTVGLEILEDVPHVDTVVVPVGGGGLVSGIALAVKALRPEVRVVGVQAAGADAMVRSVRSGSPQVVARPSTVAEGIRVGRVGASTFDLVRRLVDELVTVEEDEIAQAIVHAMEKSKVVAEAAGVVPIAALVAGRVPDARRVCAVVSGGNVDINHLARLMESGLAVLGRYHLVTLRLDDAPGQLQRVVGIVAEHQGNVLDVQHYRAGYKVPAGLVDLEVLIETRQPGDGARIDAALRLAGLAPCG
jgi:threonine dehydratase